MISPSEQYIRAFQFLVTTTGNQALDLSQLRIKFAIKKSETVTPNTADIRIYNVAPTTAALIKKDSTVILQAGYQGNFGVIFGGNVKQVIYGRESSTDTFVDILAGDGDLAFNFAVVNASLAKGSTQQNQVNMALTPMKEKGVTAGNIQSVPAGNKLPRGKVMYGASREYLRNTAQTTGQTYSIQDGKVNFIPLTSYLPGEVVVLNFETGMVGTPQQTSEGVGVKCLINPKIRVGTRIQLNNSDIARLKISLTTAPSASNIEAPVTADGVYYVLSVEYTGDSRGTEWYSDLRCLNIAVTTNPINAIQVGGTA